MIYYKQGFKPAGLYTYIKLSTIPKVEYSYFPTVKYIEGRNLLQKERQEEIVPSGIQSQL